MPPRYAYWTIVAGGLPTAFRAAEREELLPTFKRIQEKHPDAEMKYFARGKLWESQDAARREADARRATGRRPESRGRDWRPGGEHRDPRQKFKDAKKDRNLEWRKQRFERRQHSGTTTRPQEPGATSRAAPTNRPGGRPADRPGVRPATRPGERPARPEWRDRAPRTNKPQGEWRGRPPGAGTPQVQRPDRPPRGDKPQGQWQNRPPREKPHGDPLRRPTTRPFTRNRFDRNQGTENRQAPPKPKVKPPFRPSGPRERARPSGGPLKDRRRRS